MNFRHELVIPNQDLPFRMFLFEGRKENYHVVKHWHGSLEIFLVLEGNIDFYINTIHYPLTENQFLLVSSNEIHSINVKKPNKTIVLQIPESEIAEYLREGYKVTFCSGKEKQDNRLKSLIVDMYNTYEGKQYGYQLKVKSQYLMVLYLLLTEYQEKVFFQETGVVHKPSSHLSQITDYLKKNYDQELTLEGVAKQFGFSPTYLSRMFQKYANVNYKAYLQHIRLEYGYKELMNTDHTISEIALNNGFPNSKAFARTFRKYYGSLPSAYRKQLEKDK